MCKVKKNANFDATKQYMCKVKKNANFIGREKKSAMFKKNAHFDDRTLTMYKLCVVPLKSAFFYIIFLILIF